MLIHIWKAGDIAPLLVLVLLALNAVAAEEHNPATSSPDLPYSDGDLHADTWVATDALGRIQPGIAETGPPRKDKFAGIFYWTWHIPRGPGGPNDNTKLIATAKDGKIDWPVKGCPHHWGEPELGEATHN